ncbi:MAG: TolC family protein, partial [Prevotella sp.]|nr:TolC family protein [Prevotella sp.]
MSRYKYIKNITLLGFIILTGLPACQVMNKYKIPEIDSDNLYREMTSSDTTTIASIPWKEYFTDSFLILLIDEGIKKNHDLQIAYTRIQQAEANLSMAKAAYFPDISLAGQIDQSRFSNGSDGKKV